MFQSKYLCDVIALCCVKFISETIGTNERRLIGPSDQSEAVVRCHGSGVSEACNCDAGVSSLVTTGDHVTQCHASHARVSGHGAPGAGDIRAGHCVLKIRRRKL